MKKFITTILLCATLLSLSSCSQTVIQKVDDKGSSVNLSCFVIVEDTKTWKVVYHRDTGVMYAVSKDGNFTVLVDENGWPLLHPNVTRNDDN